MAGLLYAGMDIMYKLYDCREEYKKRILKDWEETKNLPRKKKKKARRELNLEWNIALYDPFGMD